MANQIIDQNVIAEEREFLKRQLNTSNNNLADLRQKYYGGAIGATKRKHYSELIRTWLQLQTGSSKIYLSDLWNDFLNDQGIQPGKLQERIRVFFRTSTGLSPNNARITTDGNFRITTDGDYRIIAT
jgi:hypothetical protein